MKRRAFLQGAFAAAGALSTVSCAPSVTCESASGATESGDKCAAGTPGMPDGAYFSQLAQDLTAAGFGTPQIIIDLDRVDANADAIVGAIGKDRYRIVEKSLPSIDVLNYINTRTGVDRFLVLHLPFLPAILAAFPNAQVMVGKPQPIAAVIQFLHTYSAQDLGGVVQRVRFLADTPARARELVTLATSLSVTLQVGVEVDVGLHRGGVRTPSDLPAVLSVFTANPSAIRFAGILGYDGHVANVPAAPGLEEESIRQTFKTVTQTYQSFVDVLHAQFAGLVSDDLVFNSGGSATFPLYKDRVGPVNDVAAGGGMLRPAAYPGTLIGNLKPASFIATPVLATYDSVVLPVVTKPLETTNSDQKSFTIYGGGWAAEFVWPLGVDEAPLVNDPENENLVPNQSWMVGPSSLSISPGDWIFQHPREGDAIFQFQNILLVRGGRLQSEGWQAFPRRY
ncbi:MAG: alanine racemase [Deltaproteobacteria bacterium]|nr:alanine racemase [Deltaproteobacteria bacterium]